MIENISRLAERVATSVSRRGFLSQLGRSGMYLAAAVGGLLALPAVAQAAVIPCCGGAGRCAPPGRGCSLVSDCVVCNNFACCAWNCNGRIINSKCGSASSL